MATKVDETAVQLAARLRLEREARNWSQADLAERSSVSKAAISKIERGEISPTAVTLVRLAGAFDLTLAGLLVRAESAGERLTRASEQAVWRDPASGYLRQQIFVRPEHPVELVEVELPPQERVTMPASSYAHIRQVVWVKSGTLKIVEGGQTFELNAGDALGFGPPADVTFSNETEHLCRYLVALARG